MLKASSSRPCDPADVPSDELAAFQRAAAIALGLDRAAPLRDRVIALDELVVGIDRGLAGDRSVAKSVGDRFKRVVDQSQALRMTVLMDRAPGDWTPQLEALCAALEALQVQLRHSGRHSRHAAQLFHLLRRAAQDLLGCLAPAGHPAASQASEETPTGL